MCRLGSNWTIQGYTILNVSQEETEYMCMWLLASWYHLNHLGRFLHRCKVYNYSTSQDTVKYLLISTADITSTGNITTLLYDDTLSAESETNERRPQTSRDLTVVTAYWDLGSFKKGEKQTFTKSTYLSWASTFQYLINPIVVYTDSTEFRDLMFSLRAKGNLTNQTKIFLVSKRKFWPFRILNQIQSVYRQPGYPAHHPNTVNAEYSAAQHSKYVAVADSAQRNIFNTSFFAWLDVGYFRDIVGTRKNFKLELPPNFNPNSVAFNRVFNSSMTMDPYRIFRQNVVWVGGGLFICSGKVGIEFEKLYQRAVLYFLRQNLMNTDQQVLYAMYSDEGQKVIRPNIGLQIYIPKVNYGNQWFYLGYLCLIKVTE
ncbi:uncharacterized protein LOC125647218 [Ostrea edulis]|uniref:uncharacterized protein LOC125647218 n=1 Tax=Ostrea edulis TaxID=37623 RepID=UPI0024AFE6B9|nr:uncharacterized protein LOC125647218 [Ostrea edulis]